MSIYFESGDIAAFKARYNLYRLGRIMGNRSPSGPTSRTHFLFNGCRYKSGGLLTGNNLARIVGNHRDGGPVLGPVAITATNPRHATTGQLMEGVAYLSRVTGSRPGVSPGDPPIPVYMTGNCSCYQEYQFWSTVCNVTAELHVFKEINCLITGWSTHPAPFTVVMRTGPSSGGFVTGDRFTQYLGCTSLGGTTPVYVSLRFLNDPGGTLTHPLTCGYDNGTHAGWALSFGTFSDFFGTNALGSCSCGPYAASYESFDHLVTFQLSFSDGS